MVRKPHPNFVKYMEFIVNHPNYIDIPQARGKDGKIKWHAFGGQLKKERKEWWEKKKIDPSEKLADVARRIHPTKKHPCALCGTELSVEYIYPTRQFIKAVLREIGMAEMPEFFAKPTDLTEFLDYLSSSLGDFDRLKNVILKVARLPKEFQQYASTKALAQAILDLPIKQRSKFLSPGVMSNAPDRLDGFHSYNICCRSSEDKGRTRENLSRYGEDRRAYEYWVEGEHKKASWLMRELRKKGWSGDHIGPLSLGFKHHPRLLRPSSDVFQSTRRNRLSKEDVEVLVRIEGKFSEELGGSVASWYVKPIWDYAKNYVINSKIEPANLAKAMREQVHDYLSLLARLHREATEETEDLVNHIISRVIEEGIDRFRESYLQNIKGVDLKLTDEKAAKIKSELEQFGVSNEELDFEFEIRPNIRKEHINNYERVKRKALEALQKYQEKKKTGGYLNLKKWMTFICK